MVNMKLIALYSEDGSARLLQNVISDQVVLCQILGENNFHSRFCENLKSHIKCP
jgi:hypothetical protein